MNRINSLLIVLLIASYGRTIFALEYIEIDFYENQNVSLIVKKTDLLFQKYFRNGVQFSNLENMVSQVKDRQYCDYFEFHLNIVNGKHNYNLEELKLLSKNGLNVMKITVGLYLESNGNYLEAIKEFEQVDFELSKVYLARLLVLQDIDVERGVNIAMPIEN